MRGAYEIELRTGLNCLILSPNMSRSKLIRGYPILTVHSPMRNKHRWNVIKRIWIEEEIKSDSRELMEYSKN